MLGLNAQDIADLPPKITHHRFRNTIYANYGSINNFYTIGDSVVTEQEVGYYLRLNHPQASRAFNKAQKIRRAGGFSFLLALGGAALGLLTKQRSLDKIGYGGFIVGTTASICFGVRYIRERNQAIKLYNLDRYQQMKKLNEPTPPPPVRQKSFSVIDTKQ